MIKKMFYEITGTIRLQAKRNDKEPLIEDLPIQMKDFVFSKKRWAAQKLKRTHQIFPGASSVIWVDGPYFHDIHRGAIDGVTPMSETHPSPHTLP